MFAPGTMCLINRTLTVNLINQFWVTQKQSYSEELQLFGQNLAFSRENGSIKTNVSIFCRKEIDSENEKSLHLPKFETTFNSIELADF